MGTYARYEDYFVERQGEVLHFGVLYGDVHVELLAVRLTEEGLEMDPEYLARQARYEARKEEWQALLDELGIAQPPQTPHPLRDQVPPEFVATREQMLEYLRLIARRMLIPAGVGKITQAVVYEALKARRLL